MKCDFNFDDIERYVDGDLSISTSENIKSHINQCRKWKKIYTTLQFTKNFIKEEYIPNTSMGLKVLAAIDTSRYQKKRRSFGLLAALHRLKILSKPLTAAFIVCIMLFLTINYGNNFTGMIKQTVLSHLPVNMKPVNILFLGGDSSNNSIDTFILIHYDPLNAQFNTLFIPRDTSITTQDDKEAKVSSLYTSSGAKQTVESISCLLNVDIQYYVYMDLQSVVKIIDLLDGVDFYIPADMNYDDPYQNLHIHLNKGQKHLNGKEFIEFIRFRKPGRVKNSSGVIYDGSDKKRMEEQKNILKALIEQKTDAVYQTKIKDVITNIYPNIKSNLSLSGALTLSQNICKIRTDEVNMFILPGTLQDSTPFYYSHKKDETQLIINQFFNSKDR